MLCNCVSHFLALKLITEPSLPHSRAWIGLEIFAKANKGAGIHESKERGAGQLLITKEHRVRGKVAIPRVLFNSFRRHFQQLQAQNERKRESTLVWVLCGMVSIRGRKRAFQKNKGKGQQSGAWHSLILSTKCTPLFVLLPAVLLCIRLQSFDSTFSERARDEKSKSRTLSDMVGLGLGLRWLFLVWEFWRYRESGERKACVSLNSRRQWPHKTFSIPPAAGPFFIGYFIQTLDEE